MNRPIPEKSLTTWLFNPFFYIAGWQALSIGLGVIAVTGIIGAFGLTHFDGVLDMHTGKPAPLWIFLSEGPVDWLVLGIVLLVLGKLISRTQFRFLDLLGTQAMARWPFVILSLFTLPDIVRRTNRHVIESLRNPSGLNLLTLSDIVVMAVLALVTILVLCWFILLSYRSFSVSCNVKGGRAIGTFIAGVLLAEIISKAVIIVLFNIPLQQLAE